VRGEARERWAELPAAAEVAFLRNSIHGLAHIGAGLVLENRILVLELEAVALGAAGGEKPTDI
jgi:hypothetical protein